MGVDRRNHRVPIFVDLHLLAGCQIDSPHRGIPGLVIGIAVINQGARQGDLLAV